MKPGKERPTDLVIRPAETGDMDGVERLFLAAIARMREQGIEQWDEIYPTRAHLEEDRSEGSLRIVEREGRMAAAVTLNETPCEEYDGIPWRLTGSRILYVHRLCVHPDEQGHGIARTVMLRIERFAAENGYGAIRLDTYAGNPRAIRLYEGLGYVFVAEMTCRKGRFPCYEKKVTAGSTSGR